MAYQINKSNGSVLVNLQDGTKDTTSTSLTLVGKNYPGYGEFLNENIVHLLENFANSSEPANKLVGQCWYDTSSGQLKFFNGTLFKATGAVTVSAAAPTSNARGDFWYKSTTDQLYVYSGTGFKLIGPAIASTSGKTGIELETLTDTSSSSRIISLLTSNGNEIGIISDAEFDVVRSGYSGLIRNGITLKDNGATGTFVLRAYKLSAGNLNSDRIPVVGTNGDLVDFPGLSYTESGGLVVSGNITATGSIGSTSGGGITAGSIAVNSSNEGTAQYIVFTSAATSDQTLKVDTTTTTPSSDSGLSYVPSTGTLLARVFSGVASTAQYADLAEKYLTDKEYAPGTVVVIGGEAEATISLTEHDKKVLGVISTAPAYLMNNEAAGQPIALRGRVPCFVVGVVRKGDLLATSSVAGHAQVCAEEHENSRAVFAKALEDKLSEGTGTIEVLIL